jgi:hypothetical protein
MIEFFLSSLKPPETLQVVGLICVGQAGKEAHAEAGCEKTCAEHPPTTIFQAPDLPVIAAAD